MKALTAERIRPMFSNKKDSTLLKIKLLKKIKRAKFKNNKKHLKINIKFFIIICPFCLVVFWGQN